MTTREMTIIVDIFDDSQLWLINNLFIFRVSDGFACRFVFNQCQYWRSVSSSLGVRMMRELTNIMDISA
jgi:hypothetical protein